VPFYLILAWQIEALEKALRWTKSSGGSLQKTFCLMGVTVYDVTVKIHERQ
jgi:hypothetical protein